MSDNTPAAGQRHAQRLLGIREVEQYCGIRKSTIYRKLARRTFPAPIDIGDGAGAVSRWCVEELDAWIETLKSAPR